jgi:hypothetical protein
VYGNTPDTLYKLDPVTNAITLVGPFQGCSGDAGAAQVIDIALDKDGQMYGTSFTGVYKIDKTNASCTLLSTGTAYPNSLSFVPAGTVDPNVEALVGFAGNQYVRIDPMTGAITTVGSLGPAGAGFASSGDVVSVIGGGTYLTVTGPNCETSDCIVQVDPKTGALVNFIGPLAHQGVYGLAYWGGAAYGFDNLGQVFKIDLSNGTTTLIPIPNAPPNLIFYGAGSSTSAPIMPPK